MRGLLPIALGRGCPVCGAETQRISAGVLRGLLRLLMGGRRRWETRRCDRCAWTGLFRKRDNDRARLP